MRIYLEEHPEFIRGAAEAECSEYGIELRRFTRELGALFEKEERFDIRSKCPSGVRIVFGTDSPFFAMAVHYGRESRPSRAIDVVIDGVDSSSFAPPDAADAEFAFNLELPPGLHELEVFLPPLVECSVQALEVADDAKLYAVLEPARTWLFLGDSITQGMTVTHASGTWAARLAAEFEADFTNLGVGGTCFDSNVAKHALEYDWETVFVAFGVNDFANNVPFDLFRQEVRGTLKFLSSRENARIFLLTPLAYLNEAGPNAEGKTLQDFRDALTALAAEFPRTTVLNGLELLPAEARYFIDGLHPNDLGMEHMTNNIAIKIQSNQEL